MKVFLNTDVKHLGEEGDVKTVANGYARNYLFPRNLALPYNNITLAYFEGKKEEIEAKKVAKRADAASLAEKLTALTVTVVMPAGPNGKLYGAVTALTIAEYLHKEGFEIDRKRIEVPGLTIKSVGKYTVRVRLYESAFAELSVVIEAQEDASRKAAAKKVEEKAEENSATDEVSQEADSVSDSAE